jgi:hypothetical protein
MSALGDVTELVIIDRQLSPQAVEELAQLKALKSLQLGLTNVGDSDLLILEELVQLENMSLDGRQLSAPAVARLQKALPKCKIEIWDRPTD